MAEAHLAELYEQVEPVEGLLALARPARLFAEHGPAAKLPDDLQQRLISKALNLTCACVCRTFSEYLGYAKVQQELLVS